MVSSEIDAPGRYTALAKFPVTTAAIPAVNLVSLEEYLSTVYEPDAEFVDGVIEERAAGEDNHSAWQAALSSFFFMQALNWNLRVRPSLRIRVSASRYRVPDVALLRADAPGNRSPLSAACDLRNP